MLKNLLTAIALSVILLMQLGDFAAAQNQTLDNGIIQGRLLRAGSPPGGDANVTLMQKGSTNFLFAFTAGASTPNLTWSGVAYAQVPNCIFTNLTSGKVITGTVTTTGAALTSNFVAGDVIQGLCIGWQ